MKLTIIKFVTSNLLLFIIIFASVLRLWKLGTIPPHLTPDEASLGYNAYSILKTGRDEFGNFLPAIFKSFGDYKPGLYVYATVPFVFIFGLNEWTVRLPSAISGIISVWLIYLIVKFLNKENKSENGKWKMENVAAMVAATNPWLIYFSRGAWEVNLALTFTLFGIYFFLKSFNSKYYILISSIFFAITLITYQGAKLSTLLVLIVLFLVFRDDCKKLITKNKKLLLISIVFCLFVISPIIFSFYNGQTGRLQVFSAFSYRRPTELVQSILTQGNEKYNSLDYYVFHSEYLYRVRTLLNHYFNHFSGKFLFFEGDFQNTRHTAPNSGVMSIVELLFLPVGLFILINLKNKKYRNFVLLWLLISSLPAVLSRDQVHAVRALNMAVPMVMLSAEGMRGLWNIISWSRLRKIFKIFIISLYIFSFVYFIDSYFVHVRIHQANDWYYGFREAVREVDKLRLSHKNVLFIQSYSQPYIYFLFYRAMDNPGGIDPGVYQRELSEYFNNNSIDVGNVGKIDNITFAGFSWPAPAVRGDIVVGTPIDIPDFYANDMFKMIDEIRQPNGNPAFRIVEKL